MKVDNKQTFQGGIEIDIFNKRDKTHFSFLSSSLSNTELNEYSDIVKCRACDDLIRS